MQCWHFWDDRVQGSREQVQATAGLQGTSGPCKGQLFGRVTIYLPLLWSLKGCAQRLHLTQKAWPEAQLKSGVSGALGEWSTLEIIGFAQGTWISVVLDFNRTF